MGKPRQHYVPQFYLRNFALTGKPNHIAQFDITSDRYVSSTAINTQASAKDFYANEQIEKALSVIEGFGASVIRMCIGKSLPKYNSEEHHALLTLVLSQLSRTGAAAEELNQMISITMSALLSKSPVPPESIDLAKFEINEAPSRSLAAALQGIHWIYDLRYKVIQNTTSIPFVTSDHPVILHNLFLERIAPFVGVTGLGTKGLTIFLPLSPEFLMVFFDHEVYKVGSRRPGPSIVKNSNIKDIRALNLLQALNCQRFLFCNEKMQLSELKRMRTRRSRSLLEKRVHGGEFVSESEQDNSLLAIHKNALLIRFRNSKISVHPHLPSPKAEGALETPMRDPKLAELDLQFSEKVRAEQNKSLADHFSDSQEG